MFIFFVVVKTACESGDICGFACEDLCVCVGFICFQCVCVCV